MNRLVPPAINTPFEDTVETNQRPLISFFNTPDGVPPREYCVQIDDVPTFDSPLCLSYSVPEGPSLVTSCRVASGDELKDGKQYHYRIKARDVSGVTSDWTTSRFFLDTGSDDSFSGLLRTSVVAVNSSGGQGAESLINWTDRGQLCFWQGTQETKEQWISFDLGEPRSISRIWQLGDKTLKEGRLEEYVWQYSHDGDYWCDIAQTAVEGADSFRSIFQFPPVVARYFRLLIRAWHGQVPRLREIILYHTGSPTIPEIPASLYALTVSNYFKGDERPFDPLLEQMGLASVVVPYYLVSYDMLQKMEPKPVAILLSGARRWYEEMPMFEFNGVYEILRSSNIAVFGSCAGHQLMAMAHGYSFVRDTGRYFNGLYQIHIETGDKVFRNIKTPFTAYELHGWEMAIIPEDMSVIARSYGKGGLEVVEMITSNSRLIYGAQFHGERTDCIGNEQAGRVVRNFLELALRQTQRHPLEVKK